MSGEKPPGPGVWPVPAGGALPAGAVPLPRRAPFLDRRAPRWAGPVAILALLTAWELAPRLGLVESLFLPPPTAVLKDIAGLAASGELQEHLQASLVRLGLGFIIGTLSGLLVGVIAGFSAVGEAAVLPLLGALYPIPKLALLPLFILWFGLGTKHKVAVLAFGIFFPVAYATWSGVKQVDPLLLKAAAAFGAGRLAIVRKVILPGAMPSILAGVRLAVGTGVLLLVAAEMVAADKGLGFMLVHAMDLALYTRVMSGVFLFSTLGVILGALLRLAERVLIRWR